MCQLCRLPSGAWRAYAERQHRNYIIFDETKTFDVCGVTVTPLPVHHGIYFTKKEPYYCLGFLFNRSIAYVSDVSFIPESTWKLLEGAAAPVGEARAVTEATDKNAEEVKKDAKEAVDGPQGTNSSVRPQAQISTRPPALIIDCLRMYPHTSHFG